MHHFSFRIGVSAALAAAVAASPFDLPEGYHRFAPRTGGITWGACDDEPTRQCGRFEVPLDYQNATAGKASLAVARYPATKQPKLGTIFLNPGGPGGSGLEFVIGGGGDVVMKTVGGQYDLVSWDPRGVGMSHPRSDCFATSAEEVAFWEGSIPSAGLEARGNFTEQADLDAFYAQVPEVDDLLLKLGKQCVEYSPDTFQYVGTAAAVRDMVAMHDLLEAPDKPIDYWGFSYGTVIGIYFVNMFPDRVGRVVIDGVVDPVYWANRPAHEIWSINVESADEALTGFVTACVAAGPDNCVIASKNSTPDSLRSDIRTLLDMAYDYKKAAGVSAQFGSARIRNLLFQGMYSPTRWPKLAQDLREIAQFLLSSTPEGSSTKRSLELFDTPLAKRENSTDEDPAVTYAIQAITCADAVDAGDITTKMVFDELVNVTRTVSPMFGPSWGIAGFYCHHWPVRAVERYTGPWDKKLSNPILVIGNEADPITPFRSAKSVADALGDSAVLIEQDDYGHASLAMHSDCTMTALENYFLKGELPTADQFCGTNQQLFPGPGVTKGTLAALSTDPNQSTNLETELAEAKARSRRLFISVIALACATGLLLISLIASCVFSRNKKKAPNAVYFTHDAFDKAHEDQGHEYTTPYDGPKGGKQAGYAPVQT